MYLIFSEDDMDYDREDDISEMEVENNDWNVTSIFDLQYFFCPDSECTYKNKSKQEFFDHIVNSHIEYLTLCSSITDDSLSDIQSHVLAGTSKNKGGHPITPLLGQFTAHTRLFFILP